MPASLVSSCHVSKANSPSLQGTLPSLQGQLGELDPMHHRAGVWSIQKQRATRQRWERRLVEKEIERSVSRSQRCRFVSISRR